MGEWQFRDDGHGTAVADLAERSVRQPDLSVLRVEPEVRTTEEPSDGGIGTPYDRRPTPPSPSEREKGPYP